MNIAYAQTAAQGAEQPFWMSLIPFIIIFVVFYFFMIRPQQKKLQKEQDTVNALKSGDEVYTKSGILGVIRGSTDRFFTLEIAQGTQIKILKSQIAGPSKEVTQKVQEKK